MKNQHNTTLPRQHIPHCNFSDSSVPLSLFFSNTETVFLTLPYSCSWNPTHFSPSHTLSLPLKLQGLADSVFRSKTHSRVSPFHPFSFSFAINWASFAYPHADSVVGNLWFLFLCVVGISRGHFMELFSEARTGVSWFFAEY